MLTAASAILGSTLYPLLRRLEFRGKRRLVQRLPAPRSGSRVVRLPGGARIQLDLAESLQREIFVGLVDRLELGLVRRVLAGGGDYVEAGAHIGVYAVTACRALTPGSRALLFEPNPDALAQLVPNLSRAGCDGATVCRAAASERAGTSVLHLPATPDAAWATLGADRFPEGRAVEVATATVDAEVERLGLTPSLFKIDVEGHELAVFAGAGETLRRARPTVLCEVSGDTAPAVAQLAGELGYETYRVHLRRLVPGYGEPRGIFNLVLLPAGRQRG